MSTANLMNVMVAMGWSYQVAYSRLAGVPFTMQKGVSKRPIKAYRVDDLPEDMRDRVAFYIAHGKPQPAAAAPTLPTYGPGDLDAAIRAALDKAIKKCGKTRERIAGEMSQIVGRKVSKFMLDSYTAASRTPYQFPLQLALAFEIATDSHCLTRLLAKRRGCGLLVGEDIALVELARIERDKLALERRAQEVKDGLVNSNLTGEQ